MKTINKILFVSLFLGSTIFAGENFSEMSTQELIAIMGYVKPHEKPKFEKELQSRVAKMNTKEKSKYEKNLQKVK